MICKCITDFILFISLACLVTVSHYLDVFSPVKQGFFCDDESLRYPLKDQTVTDTVLWVAGMAIGLFTILSSELSLHAVSTVSSSAHAQHNVCGRRIPKWIVHLYAAIGLFLFGALLNETFTVFIKLVFGRNRPNFHAYCIPSVDCRDLNSPMKFVDEYECTNTPAANVSSRESFPSGHSSLSFYLAVFSSLYMVLRMRCPCSVLLKSVLCSCLLLTACFVSLSRITDHFHHPTDVLAGSILGSAIAVVMICIFRRRFRSTDAIPENEESYMNTLFRMELQ